MMTLHNKYRNLLKSDCRYYVITGGRGSGKSYAVNTFLTMLSFGTSTKTLFTRYTMTAAQISIIPEFLDKIGAMDVQEHFDVNKAEITNKVSSHQILFRGIKTSSGDQTANLKSIQGVTTWVIDEAEELVDERIFDKIDMSVRDTSAHNRVILILNPTTKEHWIYKRFFEAAKVPTGYNGIKNNVCYIHTTYLDNIRYLNQSFINQVEEMKNRRPQKFKHQILGGWLDKAEGVIFTNWTMGEFAKDVQCIWGMDFGFSNDPTTLVQTFIDKNKKVIYLKEHVYQAHLTTSDIYNLASKIAGKELIIADSAEPRLIHELRAKGLNIQPAVKGQGSVTHGIALMQDYDLIIDGENLVKELNNYVWLERKSQTPIDDYNHIIDASRYAVSYQLVNPNRGKYYVR